MRIVKIETGRVDSGFDSKKMEIENMEHPQVDRFSLSDQTKRISTDNHRHSENEIDSESSSISADQLAKLLRERASNNSPVSVLDCRPVDAYNQGHCLVAKHISAISPPTLLYNRWKGKPDFWPGIRQKIIDASERTENGQTSTVVLIDDEQSNDELARSPPGQRANQPFSSFVLNNLRNEGCATRYLEKGAMTHFLADYPDLCVFDERGGANKRDDGNDDGAKQDKDLQFAPVRFEGDTSRRPCNPQTLNGTTPSSSLLSKRQSSSSATTAAPFLLPLLKLKDLSVKQDSACNSSTSNDSIQPSKDDRMRNGQSPSSSSSYDYEKCSSTKNLSHGGGNGEGNDRDPVNIYETLYLGNAEQASNLETLKRHNIRYILNVTSDLPNRFENQDPSFKYLRIPIVDNVTQNLLSFFPVANGFIDEAIDRKWGVLVHCLAGISRSVTFTLAYLMKAKQCSLDDAYDIVKKRKPNVEPNLNFMRQLYDYQRLLFGSDGCGGGGGGGDVTPDSAVSSLSTSSSSSVCVDTTAGGHDKEPLITSDSDTAS